MKKITYFVIIFFTFLIYSNSVFGQFSHQLLGSGSFASLNKSITKLVLTNNEDFNKAFISAVEENWEHTNYQVITEDQLKNERPSQDFTYIYIHDFVEKGKKKNIRVLALSKFAARDHQTFLNNTFAYVAFDSKSSESNISNTEYRLHHMVKQLNDIVNLIQEKNLQAKTVDGIRGLLSKEYAQNAWKLQNKTLLIEENYLVSKIASKDELLKKYKFPIEFVPKEVIEKAIKEKDETKAYLITVVNLYKINSITDCATGELLFANFVQEDPITFEMSEIFDAYDIDLLFQSVKKSKPATP